ncbi:unnamed protein product [Haemonchus placei]|uniref:RING-type domain-containing protein n=1 Tax=Haemonchus placei TaxID=6290 RepID=A0A3P7VFS6_HAEPC|nr:unnamed protein product [Haemonchus placei]
MKLLIEDDLIDLIMELSTVDSYNISGTLCPAPACSGTRSSDVIVDEMAGMATNYSKKLGEASKIFRLPCKCEARRGAFACVNVARMHLINCRHRFCYDCLSEKIDCDVYHRKLVTIIQVCMTIIKVTKQSVTFVQAWMN